MFLYKTAVQNSPLAHIQLQIDVFEFRLLRQNNYISQVPLIFSGVKAGDVVVRFVLVTVIRKSTKKTSWGTNDALRKTSGGELVQLALLQNSTCGLVT